MTATDPEPHLPSHGEPSGAGPSNTDGRGLHEQLLLGIVDALPNLVAYIGTDQRYRFVNASYERWFGRSATEIVGKHLDLGHPRGRRGGWRGSVCSRGVFGPQPSAQAGTAPIHSP